MKTPPCQRANTVIRDESQLQWLLQAVEDHRKRVPTFNKDALGAQ